MSQVFDVEVTDKNGKTRTVIAEIGGGTMTPEKLQDHYDHHMSFPAKAVQPFPGAKAWRVIPESERDAADRLNPLTPPTAPLPAENPPAAVPAEPDAQ